MTEHLRANGIASGTEYRLGRKLTLDPRKETFVRDKEANALLTRNYRKAVRRAGKGVTSYVPGWGRGLGHGF
jgi:hypothetical protein